MNRELLNSSPADAAPPRGRASILAGGAGRGPPITKVVSKQLLPVFDKPMILLSPLRPDAAGIRDILIISTPHDLPRFQELLGDGSSGAFVSSMSKQPRPEGLAQAFITGRELSARIGSA
jgi:glucose-1-phosphate thymidylyltransferase